MTSASTKRPRSLTVTLALSFFLVSLVVLLLSTALQVFLSFQSQKRVITNEQHLIAQSAASTVSNFMQERLRILNQAADINSLASQSERRDLVLHKLLGREPSFRRLSIFDMNGTEVASVSRLASGFTRPIPDTQLQPIIADIRLGKDYISPVYIDAVTSEPLVLVAIPARNSFRDIEGTLVAEVDLKFMWSLVGTMQVGEGGSAYVVDSQGYLIAYKDTSLVLAHTNVSSVPIVEAFVSDNYSTMDMFSPLSRGIAGGYVVATRENLGTPTWAVVVELPVFVAYRAVLQVFVHAVLILAISAGLAWYVGTLVAKRITNPIVRLRDMAKEISAGKTHSRIDIRSENEIGELVDAFNVMTAQIEQSYASLETKVIHRTAELDQKINELERLNKLMIDRELKMVELKKQVIALQSK